MGSIDILTSIRKDSTETSALLPKILVVDDDDQILKQIQRALSDDYQVYCGRLRTK